jgi:AsmA protein
LQDPSKHSILQETAAAEELEVMKKVATMAIALLIIALLVIGGLTLVAKSYLTDERIRSYIVAAVEQSLGRKVVLGAIQVSIFKGITVKNFEIKEKDSSEAFVKAEDFVLKYQLLPLLSKSLVIDEVKLANARLSVRKNADGTFNFSDFAGKAGAGEPKERTTTRSGLPFNLQVRSFSLKDTVIEYAEPAGKLSKARIKIDADLGLSSPSAGVISSAGNFRITIAEAFLKDNPRPLRDLTSQGTYKIDLDLSAKKADILEVKADIAKVPITLKGYASYADPISFSLDLNMPETRLATVQQAAAPFLPEGAALDGAASFAVSAGKSSSTGNRLTFKGHLIMNRVAITVKGYRPVFSGTIGFTPDLIRFDGIRLIAGESSADISGQIRNYNQEPDLQVSLKAKNLNLDAITSAGQRSVTEKTAAPSPKKEEKEFEPMNKIKLRAAGSVASDNILVKGMSIQNFHTAFEFKDNILRIPSMTGNTMNGSFRLQSAIDLSKRGTAYTLNADANGVRLEDITTAFAPKARDTLYGSLYGKMNLSGAGTLKESIKRNLKGNGSFTIKDGKIKNAEVSSSLLTLLGLQNLREIPMVKADSTFTVADSIVNLTTLITSKDLILDEKGTIGMDERLDLGIMVKASEKLAPKMLSQPSISQFLSEEQGWTNIPLRVSGTITKPSYSIDMQYVGKKATEKLRKKAGEELFKALSGDKEEKGKTRPQEQKKRSSPEDLLKGIFGK